jgi:hypothetical protein
MVIVGIPHFVRNDLVRLIQNSGYLSNKKDMNMKKEIDERSNREKAFGAAIGLVLGAALGEVIVDSSLVALIGMILGAIIGYRYMPQIHLMEYPREVVLRLVLSGVVFLFVLLVAIYLLENEPRDTFSMVIAFAPAIPGLFFFVFMADAISRLDELQRRIQVEAIAIGFGISLLLTMVYGLLGLAGLPQASWLYVSFIMIFSWLVGKLWIRWKYR